jgi:hypothetical protein
VCDVDDCDGEVDSCGVCNGIATGETGCFIELSIGSVADGMMEIILNNTIPILGFQFNIAGTSLGGVSGSGGSAEDAGFQVNTGNTGADDMVLGFSMIGDEIPQGNGVLTNISYTATNNEACLTDEILALGDWAGGFYEILIGDCVALDYDAPTTTLSVTYSSDTDIYGFQFNVDGANLVNASGGEAETTFDLIDYSSETGVVLGLSFFRRIINQIKSSFCLSTRCIYKVRAINIKLKTINIRITTICNRQCGGWSIIV